MSLPEEIMMELEELTDQQKQEVLDFARFLRRKEDREFRELISGLIDENIVALKELAK